MKQRASLSSPLPPDLAEALRQPFAPQEVRLQAGKRRQTAEGGAWVCLAVPVIPFSSVKARLEQHTPGRWSASLPSLIVAGDRLVVVAQVQLDGKISSASSEVPFPQSALLATTEELLTLVPEVFEAAFVKACTQFGLGRYLTDLAREWVPFDAAHGRLALSTEQQQAHLLKLYRQAGFSVPPPSAFPILTSSRQGQGTSQVSESQTRAGDTQDHSSASPSPLPLSREALRVRKIAWVRQQCASHPGSLARILTRWQVYNLEALSDDALREVVTSIQQSSARALPKAS